jgi:predicted transcriptional regulator
MGPRRCLKENLKKQSNNPPIKIHQLQIKVQNIIRLLKNATVQSCKKTASKNTENEKDGALFVNYF